jgi:phosphoglycerate dehydrogenase-like enzyme/predicted dehydrogenase
MGMPVHRPAPWPLRVLIIGAGPTAVDAHLPVLRQLRDRGEIVLAVVCDIEHGRASSAQRVFGFKESSGDARAAIARDDIDAVYVFGSAQLHFECGLAALIAGKHLFVEKPVAPSYLQARDLAQVAQEHALIAVGGLNRRFFKSLAAVRERAGGSRWRFAEAIFHKPEFQKPPPFGAGTWLTANGIHALDALVYMMGGLPQELTSFTGERSTPTPSAFSALMRWQDGAQGVFLCNNNSGSRREEYVFHGLGETCTVDGSGLKVEKSGKLEKTILPSIGDGFAAEHEAFLQAIRDGQEPPHSIAAIAPSLYLAELIEQGHGGQVRLPEAIRARSARSPISSTQSILVAPSAELQPGLGRLLPEYGLVSLDAVREASCERRDIVAAILGRGAAPLTSDILDKLPRLRIVGIMALSLSRYEPEALLARDITVVNAGEAYADSVAEFALGLAILGRRRAFASHRLMRAGGWGITSGVPGIAGAVRRTALRVRPAIRVFGLESVLLRLWRGSALAQVGAARGVTIARDLRGAAVGLIGWGKNARAFASHLMRLGATVLVYSEHAQAGEIESTGAIRASLGEVLGAEIVSLHRGLTSGTRHCLGEAELAKLRPGTVLINTARGGLIEPNALLARLRRGDIFACLDTYDEEPLPGSHPLRGVANVFLTSHIAGGSPDMHAAAADEVIDKVAAFLRGDVVESISNARLRTMT